MASRKLEFASRIIPIGSKAMTACERCNAAILAVSVEPAKLLGGDIGGELDDLHDASGTVAHGIIARLDPDMPTTLGDPLELGVLECTRAQGSPEGAILSRVTLSRVYEHRVMLPAYLGRV